MIRDRGNIKWTAMMLPEHVVELRKWMDQDNYTERPELNEWDLQLIQEELEVAYKSKCETLVKTWVNGKIVQFYGIIEGIDLQSNVVNLDDPFGMNQIRVSEIIAVQVVD